VQMEVEFWSTSFAAPKPLNIDLGVELMNNYPPMPLLSGKTFRFVLFLPSPSRDSSVPSPHAGAAHPHHAGAFSLPITCAALHRRRPPEPMPTPPSLSPCWGCIPSLSHTSTPCIPRTATPRISCTAASPLAFAPYRTPWEPVVAPVILLTLTRPHQPWSCPASCSHPDDRSSPLRCPQLDPTGHHHPIVGRCPLRL
jgi:hypothetical protein